MKFMGLRFDTRFTPKEPKSRGTAYPAYIKAQLEAFATAARHNDISEQMRNIARQMTPEEIDAGTTPILRVAGGTLGPAAAAAMKTTFKPQVIRYERRRSAR